MVDDEEHHTEDSDGADLMSGTDFLHLEREGNSFTIDLFFPLFSLKYYWSVAVWLNLRHSLLVEAAEDDGGQRQDQHEDAHGDGNHLVHVSGSASVVADKEAAVTTVRGRATVEVRTHTQNFRVCIPEGWHEPTCTRRDNAAVLGRSQAWNLHTSARACVLLTYTQVCQCPGGRCTGRHSYSSLHVRLRRVCRTSGSLAPPWWLQTEIHFTMKIHTLQCVILKFISLLLVSLQLFFTWQ